MHNEDRGGNYMAGDRPGPPVGSKRLVPGNPQGKNQYAQGKGTGKNAEQIAFRLPTQLKSKIEAIALQRGITKTQLLTDWLEQKVSELERSR